MKKKVFISIFIIALLAIAMACIPRLEKSQPLVSMSSAAFSCDHPRETATGLIQGAPDEEEKTCVWKGIPYAAPPTGDLRWQAPQPAEPWQGIKDATRWGSDCMQKKLLDTLHFSPAGISEDCLYLNIWSPRKAGTYPVMVWFHGGAYFCGMAASPMYHGARLSAGGDVVVVTVNYRLGAFGFFAHESLAQEDPNGSTGNYGTLDQIAALQWVQENISAFGGDQKNVTIFGQSGGGWSVCTLLATPLAQGLFHKAILESGGCETMRTLEEGYEAGRRATERLGCSDNNLDCLRDKSAKEVLKEIDSSLFEFLDGQGLPYINHNDGYVLSATPLARIQANTFNNVPILAGTNKDEFQPLAYVHPLISWKPWQMVMSKRRYKKRLEKNFGKDVAETLFQLYPPHHYESNGKALSAILADRVLICPLFDFVQAAAVYQPATYYYRFDYEGLRFAAMVGAFHIMEVPFVFQNFDRKPLKWFYIQKDMELPMLLSRVIQGYWINFAYTGNPNGPGLPCWPAYQPELPLLQVLDQEIRTETPGIEHKAIFWEEYKKTNRSAYAPGGFNLN